MTYSPHNISCNGAQFGRRTKGSIVDLNYLGLRGNNPNVRIGLPKLVKSVYYLPPRILDLVEIACYVFAGDRYSLRGPKEAVEYQSWSRQMKYAIKVRDLDFWNRAETKAMLSDALTFMTGDKSYDFEFQGGHSTDPVDLFDSEEFVVESSTPTEVILFSGGLDSLAGAVDLLESSEKQVCLVSHQSGQPDTIRTQNGLVHALSETYSNRIKHYRFNSGLKDKHAKEETQRTRSFLFSSVAFAIATAHGQDHFSIYENGVTSMNLPRREDLINARASRTTHPKTIYFLKAFFSYVAEKTFLISTPFLLKTKTDVLMELRSRQKEHLLTSSVSCSKTFQRFEHDRRTHCGMCYQCLDRRFAVYGSGLEDSDNPGLYNTDFVQEAIPDSESKVSLFGYLKQAQEFAESNNDALYETYASQLVDIIGHMNLGNDNVEMLAVLDLIKKHGNQVWDGIRQMKLKHESLTKPVVSGSLIDIINHRDHLLEPVDLVIRDIAGSLDRSIPILYQARKPKNENEFNDAVESILAREKVRFEREYPVIPFALCKTVPDHSWSKYKLLIESKYPRKTLTMSKLTNQIGEDVFKYPKDSTILFVIYDPQRKINDDVKFKKEICSADRRCRVQIIR